MSFPGKRPVSRICTQRPTPYFIKQSFRICASSFDHPGEGVKFHLRSVSVTEPTELLVVSPSAALVRLAAELWHAHREAASPTLGPRLCSASRADISLALLSSAVWPLLPAFGAKNTSKDRELQQESRRVVTFQIQSLASSTCKVAELCQLWSICPDVFIMVANV